MSEKVALSNIFEFFLDRNFSDAIFTDMNAGLDRKIVKEKAVDLAFAARSVIQQLTLADGSAEAREARDILERALTNAIPDGVQMELPTKAAA